MNLVYGIVLNNRWYSNRMEFPVRGLDDGIYSMDMDQDDFKSTIEVADILDARNYFSKVSQVTLIRGIVFKDSLIPENPTKYPQMPLKVNGLTYCDDFDEVEIVCLKKSIYYFLQILSTIKSYSAIDVKVALDQNISIKDLRNVTPDLKIAYAFHLFEKKKKELLEPDQAIRKLMGESGAEIKFIRPNNKGYEVQWEFDGNSINTQMDKNYRVMEAGFCVSNWDKTQSASSLVNVLKDYIDDGSYINKTRVLQ